MKLILCAILCMTPLIAWPDDAAFKASEKPGTPLAKFMEHHREPDSIETEGDDVIYYYDEVDEPLIFTFRSDKLYSRRVDRVAKAQKEERWRKKARDLRRKKKCSWIDLSGVCEEQGSD